MSDSDTCLQEELTASEQSRIQSRSRLALGAGTLVLLSAGAAAVAVVTRSAREGGAEASEDLIGFTQIVAQKPKPMCSKPWSEKSKEDCSATKCCTVSGYSCFEKTAGVFGCVDKCDPAKGWTCRMPHDIVPLVEVSSWPNANLFCYAVYTKETGSTKRSYELELLQGQYSRKASLFGCESYAVYSDADADIGGDLKTIKVNDVENEFHVVKRKTQHTWVNTGLFKQVWKDMRVRWNDGLNDADWVVKVDADAVFLPERLRKVLSEQADTYTGVYLENCKGVEYGYFGNLEVSSKKAFKLLLDNLESCSQKIDWVKGTKLGPIGEDLFAQMCMDWQGVAKVSNFEVTTDGACPSTRKRYGQKDNKKWKPPCGELKTPALHPFKKPVEYFQCLDATSALGV